MAKNHKNVIEINGKLYDTNRGVLIGDKSTSSNITLPQTIDSFVAPKPHIVTNTEKLQAQQLKTVKPVKQRYVSKPQSRHTQQKSITLMRKSVKKTTAKKSPEISPFYKKNQLYVRSNKASQSSRSPLIKKYNNTGNLTKRTEAIAVVTPPTSHSHTKTTKPKHIAPSLTNKPTKLNMSEQLFADALQKAKPPAKPIKKRKSNKALKWSSGILAGILLTGFVAYLNLPNLNIKLASTQAGFSATMPKQKPSGYSYKSISHEAGKVIINFKSSTDERTYTINQEVSSWNSQSLQDNFLTSSNKSFTTAQDSGRTVYIYENNNATWVNGGIWFKIESSSLNSDQLLDIASSM